jgi:hypothetical protein
MVLAEGQPEGMFKGMNGLCDFHSGMDCDRSEDGFTSMVPLLSICIGQPVCLLHKGSDPAGLQVIAMG